MAEDRRDDSERTRDGRRDDSAALRRGWYPVIGGATLILLLFIAGSLFRGTFPSAFGPLFILSALGMIAGTAYVIRALLTEK